MEAIRRVLKYLRYIVDYELHYTSYPIILEGHNDANRIYYTKYLKSINGYVFTLGGSGVL
jgi:hypothetical protein